MVPLSGPETIYIFFPFTYFALQSRPAQMRTVALSHLMSFTDSFSFEFVNSSDTERNQDTENINQTFITCFFFLFFFLIVGQRSDAIFSEQFWLHLTTETSLWLIIKWNSCQEDTPNPQSMPIKRLFHNAHHPPVLLLSAPLVSRCILGRSSA